MISIITKQLKSIVFRVKVILSLYVLIRHGRWLGRKVQIMLTIMNLGLLIIPEELKV